MQGKCYFSVPEQKTNILVEPAICAYLVDQAIKTTTYGCFYLSTTTVEILLITSGELIFIAGTIRDLAKSFSVHPMI